MSDNGRFRRPITPTLAPALAVQAKMAEVVGLEGVPPAFGPPPDKLAADVIGSTFRS